MATDLSRIRQGLISRYTISTINALDLAGAFLFEIGWRIIHQPGQTKTFFTKERSCHSELMPPGAR